MFCIRNAPDPSITAGDAHSAALRGHGTVIAWGNNVVGQTNVPPNLIHVIRIVAGSDHTLALTSDEGIVAWGYNGYHQIEVPPRLSNVVAIAAGDSYSMALRADGSLVLWGAPGPVTNLPPDLRECRPSGRPIAAPTRYWATAR